METHITVEGFDRPKNRRSGPDGTIVDVQGQLRAPTDWVGEHQLEQLWNRRHGRAKLGVGLAVANSHHRHIILTNVPDDLDWVRRELESFIAELEPTDDAEMDETAKTAEMAETAKTAETAETQERPERHTTDA